MAYDYTQGMPTGLGQKDLQTRVCKYFYALMVSYGIATLLGTAIEEDLRRTRHDEEEEVKKTDDEF